ncbi:MAG: hypothetical protein AAFQ09_03710 [Pseudomonadota bacterium]
MQKPPNFRRIVALLFSFLALGLTIGCSKTAETVPVTEKRDLNLDGALERYHSLLELPYSEILGTSGFIIGIEKAPRDRIAFPSQSTVGDENGIGANQYDQQRLRPPSPTSDQVSDSDIDAQRQRFDGITSDGKVMFVSHILSYRAGQGVDRIQPELLYTTFSQTGFSDSSPACGKATVADAYAQGWRALDCLSDQIDRTMTDARRRGRPYTHIFLLSMGWNNDQQESLRRYNAIVSQTLAAAQTNARDQDLNLLVIGITWPSVWGGTSISQIINRGLHLFSYPAKTDDADEIGFGIANKLMNGILPTLEQKHDVHTVAIGHSMGARILSRAYYSSHMLVDAVDRTAETAPILIGLQPAFSANRFARGADPSLSFGNVRPGEGGPYQDHQLPGGLVALTWSQGDYANPLARYLTGALHLGAEPGYSRAKQINREGNVVFQFGTASNTGRATACPNDGKILLEDASAFILSHSDIQNAAVGRFVWSVMGCR